MDQLLDAGEHPGVEVEDLNLRSTDIKVVLDQIYE